jgi:ubiquinone/menaquinone biosynthesis C-methylase UbiE
MNETKSDSSQLAQNWNAYWQGSGGAGAFSSEGANHPAILAFWNDFFSTAKEDYPNPALLDIASGNGAVIEHALNIFEQTEIDISCVDISEAAIGNIKSRFSNVHGVVSDARSIPLEPRSFNLVTSQFGLEYAGLEAVDEAVKMMAEGGRLGLLMHHQPGLIFQECKANLEAITLLQKSGFIPLSAALFRAAFAAVRGADRTPYDEAGSKLAPALTAVENILRQFGQGIADETIVRLYSDVADIHSNVQQYDPVEVDAWLKRMNDEVATYSGRMSSMCSAAIDATAFEGVFNKLGKFDCQVDLAGPLSVPGNEAPLAWAIIATHRSP